MSAIGDAFPEALPLVMAALVILGVSAFMRWLSPKVTRALDVLDVLKSIDKTIDVEMSPNEGKSIKDAVFAIRDGIDAHNRWSKESHDEQDAKLNKILERLP